MPTLTLSVGIMAVYLFVVLDGKTDLLPCLLLLNHWSTRGNAQSTRLHTLTITLGLYEIYTSFKMLCS